MSAKRSNNNLAIKSTPYEENVAKSLVKKKANYLTRRIKTQKGSETIKQKHQTIESYIVAKKQKNNATFFFFTALKVFMNLYT